MPSRVIFVIRRSPDWRALAAAHARGAAIDPKAYLPATEVPDFPATTAASIARWNARFAIDFFACRAALTDIARATLDAVADAAIVPVERVPDVASGARIAFLDDDDWFAPDAAQQMAQAGEADVAVFPLLRLDVPVFTFARQVTPASPIIGLASRFHTRYQTNNYALHARLATPSCLAVLSDHITASAAADAMGLNDVYCDTMLSVTNKSPVAASVVARILADEDRYVAHVGAFVASLRGLVLPEHAGWMRLPIERTAALFAAALPSGERLPSQG